MKMIDILCYTVCQKKKGGTLMRGLVVTRERALLLAEDIPMPEVGEYDALVQNACCIICNGTDQEIIRGALAEVGDYPVMLGHESAGYVVRRGAKARHYREGDLVVRSIVRKNEKYGCGWGGFSEYGLVTDYRAMVEDHAPDADRYTIGCMQGVFPKGFTPVQAAMAITYKETYSAFARLGVQPGDALVLVGDGPVALCMAGVARLFQAKELHIIGENERTMGKALSMGASAVYNHLNPGEMELLRRNCGKRAQFYIDTIGTNQTLAQGLPLLAPDGVMAVYGLHSGDVLTLPLAGMRNFGIRFMQFPIHAKEGAAHEKILEAAGSGLLDLDALVTHRLPIQEYEKGFELVRSKEGIKVALLFQ